MKYADALLINDAITYLESLIKKQKGSLFLVAAIPNKRDQIAGVIKIYGNPEVLGYVLSEAEKNNKTLNEFTGEFLNSYSKY